MQDDKIIIARKKIADILKLKGPSLPVQIAREIGLSSLFAGALLSELAKDKVIRISHMKVGGSPLYFLKGQEPMLEKFHTYLTSKEKEAFLMLQKSKIIEDKTQTPAIRVALRQLKDFAFPFSKDNEIFWRFHTASEEEAVKPLKPVIKSKIEDPKPKIEPKTKQLDIGLKQIKKEPIKQIIKTLELKPKKEKQDPEFPSKIISLLQSQNIEILEKVELKRKEFSAIINIDSALGKIRFFCAAKDKKRITENDLRVVLQKSQTLKMPALLLFPEDINKKALEYAQTCPLLKLKRIGKTV